MSKQDDQPKHLDWNLGHGPISGPVNAAWVTFGLGALGHAFHVGPLVPLGVGAVAALGAIVHGLHRRLTRAAHVYWAACCAGAACWDAWASATTPWSIHHAAFLAGGAVLAGLLAPAVAHRTRPEIALSAATMRHADTQARVVTPPPQSQDQRDELAAEWAGRLARVCKIRDARVVGIQTWEHNTGYTLDVQLPPGGHTWQNLKIHADGLAGDASLPPGCGVEVLHGADRGCARIRVATSDALTELIPYPDDHTPTSVSQPIPIGLHRDASLAEVNLRFSCMLLVGQTDSGKSNTIAVLNAGLTRTTDALIWHIDLTGGISAPWLAPWLAGDAPAPAIDWPATTVAEATVLCRMAIAIINHRKIAYRDLMLAADDDKIPVSAALPEIVIVVDEFADLPAEIKGLILTIVNTGRPAGVRAVVCALRATGDSIPVALRKQCRIRAGMRVADLEELAYLFDWRTALPSVEEMRHPGYGALSPDGSLVRLMRVYRIKPRQIGRVAIAVAPHRPTLDEVSASAGGAKLAHAYATRWQRCPLLATTPPAAPMEEPMTPSTPDDSAAVATSLQDMRRSLDATAEALRRAVAEKQASDAASGDGTQDVDWDARFAALTRDLNLGASDDEPDGKAEPTAASSNPEPAADSRAAGPPDARARMLALLDQAGPDGSTPQQLETLLRAENYPTWRQTIWGWLHEEIDAGVVVHIRRGRYALTKHHQ